MAQYIDKAAVVAEIKKLVRKNELYLDDNVSDVVRYQKAGAYSVLNDLLHFLNTFEVKEVDLEKSLTGFMGRYAYENGGEYPSAIDIAKYFLELGFKAQKGK